MAYLNFETASSIFMIYVLRTLCLQAQACTTAPNSLNREN